MLVVVEDRDVTFLFQLALDLEAAGSRDVFEVDAAEGTGDHVDGLDDGVDIFGLDAKRERVYIAKVLEENTLAFHDRHACFRSDVAKAENGGAVGDDEAHVMTTGQFVALLNVLLDLKAGLRDAGGVRQRKVVLVFRRDGRNDFDFTFPLSVQSEGFFCVIHGNSFLSLKST